MMNRSGYIDDLDSEDQWAFIRWRGAVTSAIRGRRGQAFLEEMLGALDALPTKELTVQALDDGASVCALGSVGKAREIDMTGIDPEDYDTVAGTLAMNDTLAREIMWLNDDAGGYKETPCQRFERMRKWILRHMSWT